MMFIGLSTVSFAQKETHGLFSISRKLELNYNRSCYDSIFNMFSAEMKLSMPIEKTITFFTDLKKQAGNMTGREFTGYKDGYAVYKTYFERGTYLMNLAAGLNSQIIGMIIEPYTK